MFIFSGVLRQDLPEGAEGEDLPSDGRGGGGGFLRFGWGFQPT